jgi:hypothetical protein
MGNNIRIGKDFNVQWTINKVVDGERLPYDLVGKELQLYIVNDNGRKEVAGWKVQGNVIEWTYLGKDQRRLGAYQLVLVENAGKEGMVTVDTCKAFNLVEHSCEENVDGGNDIVIKTVTLESEVALAPVVKEVGGGASEEDIQEIKNDIADLQQKDVQTDAKLTELSERVGDLEEEKPIFKAVYGTTTIEEVIAAYESGIVVHCDYNNYCYVLSRLLGGEAYFSAVDGQISSRLFCSKNSNWSVRNFSLEQTSNKTTSLSDKSTDTQYPSAKAVYDALQNVGGGSKEWKCVVDRRMEIGEKNLSFDSFADGTPLKAEEAVVQIIIDQQAGANTNGYISIESSNNKTASLYGIVYYEFTAIDKISFVSQARFKASPFAMVAEIVAGINTQVAIGDAIKGVLGNQNPPQIYEDITCIKLQPNSAITSAPPHILIYAR